MSEHFDNIKDRDREVAVFELILRSPEVSEMMAYDELYFEIVDYYRWKEAYLAAIQWSYAWMAFSEQHDERINRISHRRALAKIYLAMGEFDTGLLMYTHMLQADPGSASLFTSLGLEMPKVGLSPLAIDVNQRLLVNEITRVSYGHL